jgi:hypothetical protein
MHATLVLIINSTTGHARWFTPSDHLSGGLALDESSAALGPQFESGATKTALRAAEHFVHCVAASAVALCREHAIEAIVLLAPERDGQVLKAELTSLPPPVPALLLSDPNWAELPPAELCSRLARAGLLPPDTTRPSASVGQSGEPLPSTQGQASTHLSEAVTYDGSKFQPSGLTDFERRRLR